jgi:hypothetical protein
LFESWQDVKEYAHSFAGRDLLPIVQMRRSGLPANVAVADLAKAGG